MDDRKVLSSEVHTSSKNADTGSGTIETTQQQSVLANQDGSKSLVNKVIEKKTGTGIIGDPQKIEEYSLGVQQGDTKYIDAIKSKDDLAIMYEDKLLNYIKVSSFEKILHLMEENLNSYFDCIAYGIYSSEEIIELRNSMKIDQPKNENYSRNLDAYLPEDPKLQRNKKLNDDLFDNVQRELDRIRE